MGEKKAKITAVKGMYDVMPPDSHLWNDIEAVARRVFSTYGYDEMRTPVVEVTDLFVRSVGETTSVVEKEMYSFTDRNGDPISLRPEGTASVVRAYIESGTAVADPVARYYYMGPMFRYERPQKGRQREFHQIGLEVFGVDSPMADVETMATFVHLLSELKIEGVILEINSIGCDQCRPPYNQELVKFLKNKIQILCDDCKRRLERNPLRVFDCKNEACIRELKDAPRISSWWCDTCKTHLHGVEAGLKNLGIHYILNERIVRGLDYYLRTAFEFTTTKLGAQNAVAAGGRYDGLVRDLGGPDIPGVGYAIGVERLVLLMENEHGKPKRKQDLVYFAIVGETIAEKIFPTIQLLRKDGVRVEWDFGARSLKSQMRRADRLNAESVVIVGEDEIAKGHAIVRDMRAKTQHEVKLTELPMHFVQIGG
jgi:histidyl-tRNA synthetase